MPYIGRGIETLSDRVVLDSLTASATASYTLQLNSVNFVPSSASSLTVSLNGVIQKPDSSYTVSSSTLTFSSALTSSDSIDFIIAERDITLQTPSAGSVGTSQLANSAVDLTSKVTGALPVANGGTALTSGFANGITVADQWRVTSGFTGDANPISSNWERNDTTGAGFIGSAMTQSSGIFTFPSTGIYRVDFHVTMSLNSNSRYNLIAIMKTLDNSSYAEAATTYAHISNNTSSTTYASAHADTIIDVTNTSNVKVSFQVEHHDNNTTVTGGSAVDYTWAHFLRLGDT